MTKLARPMNYHIQPHVLKKVAALGAIGMAIALIIALAIALVPPHRPRQSQPLAVPPTASNRTLIDLQTLQHQWIVSPDQANQLLAQGATLLDARYPNARQTLQGSVMVSWQPFSQPRGFNHGKLLTDDAALSQQLQAVGVSSDRPVVVVADPLNGWGEEGRIVWMLRSLGHSAAVLVDGGYSALAATGIPLTSYQATIASIPGTFVVNRTTQWDISRDQLRADLSNPNVVIIDVRERREYNGKTPYGEQRGGHLPGAIHIYYKELLDSAGNMLPRPAILAKLASQGVTPDTQVVTYCTGGIRSGWFTAVLTSLGLDAKNYSGSAWEWAAAPAGQYPLTSAPTK